MARPTGDRIPVDGLEVRAYRIPTDAPESDGTLAWSETVLVVVEPRAGGKRGLGYTYAHAAAAALVREKLAGVVAGMDLWSIPAIHEAMLRETRNLGRPGLVSMAVSAVDAALWDLKARHLELPLCTLLGEARERVEVYGSGGFTSYDDGRLAAQLGGWVEAGIGAVKMKVGRDPDDDLRRVRVARGAIGPDAALYVDANGAWREKEALAFAGRLAELGVVWLEEPVSSDDLAGLRRLRARAPAGMEIAAGEYGSDAWYFARMLGAEAVDVLQLDATRCGGPSGFLAAASLARAGETPISAHTAPSLHLHLCAAAPGRMRPLEYFHDHVRIERMLFDGAAAPVDGALVPDLSRPGFGLELKREDAARYAL